MKEAFWGVLIVALGLFGIVVINIFQKATVTNDEVYYLLKETTEASMLDSIDLAYYKLNGDIRIVHDKFAENFARRFAENISEYTINQGNYKITIGDINEVPPRVSVEVQSGVTSLKGDYFGIINRLDAIIEAKYSIEDVTNFLGITEEEWINKNKIEANEEDKNSCMITKFGNENSECITGDMKFEGWEDIKLPKSICPTEEQESKKRGLTYKVCECGKWKEYKSSVIASPKESGNEYVYEWTYKKDGTLRNIDETIKEKISKDICTTEIKIMVPKESNNGEIDYADNKEKYVECTSSGVKIILNKKSIMYGNYIPEESVNRDLNWEISNKEVASLITPINNPGNTTGYSYAKINALKEGTAIVTATPTTGKAATCKVTVWDGNVDSVGCVNKTLTESESGQMVSNYTPKDATNTNFTWTSSDTNIATIDKNNGKITAKKAGTATITITSSNGKTGTCTVKVEAASSGGGGGEYYSGACSCPVYREELRGTRQKEIITHVRNYDSCAKMIEKQIPTTCVARCTTIRGGRTYEYTCNKACTRIVRECEAGYVWNTIKDYITVPNIVNVYDHTEFGTYVCKIVYGKQQCYCVTPSTSC